MKTLIPVYDKGKFTRNLIVISTITEPHIETMVFPAKLRAFSSENFKVDYKHPIKRFTKRHENLKAAVEYHISLIKSMVKEVV